MAINLEYKMKEGQVYLYDVIVNNIKIFRDSNNEEKEVDEIKMKLTQKVSKVLPNGEFELEIEIDPVSFLRNNAPQEIAIPTQTMKMVMDKKGKVISSTMDSPVSSPSFPDKPIEIGETWISKTTLRLAEGSPIELNYYYTAKGFEKVKNLDAILIEVSSDKWENNVNEVHQSLVSKGNTLFSVDYGALLKSDVETEVKAKLTNNNQEFISNVKVSVILDKLIQKDLQTSEEGFLIK